MFLTLPHLKKRGSGETLYDSDEPNMNLPCGSRRVGLDDQRKTDSGSLLCV